MNDLKAFLARDAALNPLLERLTFLEAANKSLKAAVAEGRFGAEMQIMALREQLQSARLEIEHQQEILDNLGRETCVAVRERQATAAAVEQLSDTRKTLLSELTDIQERLAAALRGEAESKRVEQELACKLQSAVEERTSTALRAERAMAEKETLLQAMALVREQWSEERQLRAQAEEQARKTAETLAAREALHQQAAEEDRQLRAGLIAQYDSLRLQEPPPSPQREAPKPAPETWSVALPALRGAVSDSFARLKQLPLGAIAAGPRAMIRMAAASLTQTSDMLQALEEFYSESFDPLLPGRAEMEIDAALAAWEGQCKKRRIALFRRVDAGLPLVLLRGKNLRTAISHVLRNSYEAMPRGGSATVQVSRDAALGGVNVRISDTGPGFSARARESFFEPFALVRPGHLGLGLSLARKLLRACGGDVEAANGSSKGAVVTLRLPISA